MLLLNEVTELSFLPKAVFAFLLLGWQGCLEKSANMRSRLSFRLPGDKAEKNPLPCLHALTSALVPGESGRLSPGDDLDKAGWQSGERGWALWSYTGLTPFLSTVKPQASQQTSLSLFPYL